jgi:rare lipoprotein A
VRGSPWHAYRVEPLSTERGPEAHLDSVKLTMPLACLMTSASAIAQTPEENITQSTGVTPGNSETPTDSSRSFACTAAQERWPADYGSEWVARQSMRFEPITNAYSSAPDPCCGPVRVANGHQFGKASWYDQVGSPTASGESLDTFTATAAHRSLPLASYAKVTNLDNRRSVIVKINDRGPYIRGRIIDLSPRAADVLEMKRSGVVAVVVEPLVY